MNKFIEGNNSHYAYGFQTKAAQPCVACLMSFNLFIIINYASQN